MNAKDRQTEKFLEIGMGSKRYKAERFNRHKSMHLKQASLPLQGVALFPIPVSDLEEQLFFRETMHSVSVPSHHGIIQIPFYLWSPDMATIPETSNLQN